MNKRRLKHVLFALVFFLIIIQFVQPARTNPPTTPSRTLQAQVPVPPQIQGILKRACYDCHSNQTVWPWYAHVAPVSWLVTDDVQDARRKMNFDNWDSQATAGTVHMMCQDVREGDMPLWYYRPLHSQSHLSGSDVTAICAWADSMAASQPTGPPSRP
jgi:hypothetical protein